VEPTGGSILRGLHLRPNGSANLAAATSPEPEPAPEEAPEGSPVASEAPPPIGEELRRLHDIAETRGYREGLARAERELTGAIVAVGAWAAQFEAEAPTQKAALAGWVTELSLAVARRILGDAIQTDPSLLVTAVERAIGAADASPDVRILLHPTAVSRVREEWEAIHGVGYLGKRWTFGPDRSLPLTGCLVRYQHGLVDASIDAQLEAIAAALRTAIGGDDPAIEIEPLA
jgi:type III secretion protein L